MFGIYDAAFKEISSIINSCATVDEAIIYGSRAKGHFKEGSDIDLTLKGIITMDDYNKLLNELDDSYLPFKFDISIYDDIKNAKLLEHIQRVGKTFYTRNPDNNSV